MTQSRPPDVAGTQTPWRVVGGPLGRHTTDRARSLAGWAGILVALTAIPTLLGLVLRGWCLVNGFGGQVPLWRACYSDLPSMLGALRAGEATGDPIVTGAVTAVLAEIVPGTGADARAQTAFVIGYALLAVVLLAALTLAVGTFRIEEPERALLLVLCPALPLGLLISADLVGVLLAVLAVLAWRLRHDATAGALLALAVFSRSYALILAVVLVASALQHGRSVRRLGLGGLFGLVVVGALATAMGWQWLSAPLKQWWNTVPSYGSVWMVPNLAGSPISQSATPWIALGGWVLAGTVVLWVAWRPRPQTSQAVALGDLALVGVAMALLTSTAVPVQASLWLVPLVALSSLTWRDMLIWAGIEVAYFPMVWLYLGGLENPNRGLPAGWYSFFLLLRLAAIGYLAVRAAGIGGWSPPASPAGTGEGGRDESSLDEAQVEQGRGPSGWADEFAPVRSEQVP